MTDIIDSVLTENLDETIRSDFNSNYEINSNYETDTLHNNPDNFLARYKNGNFTIIGNGTILESDIRRMIEEDGQNNPFFELHVDPRNNKEVITLTEYGLIEYFKNRRERTDLLNNTELIIDWNRNVDSNFSPEIREITQREIINNSRDGERHNYIIHRDGHTVALMQEGDTFLLLDSYNAHGTPDMDHLPLLRMIRNTLPDAKICTLHDRIQSDYNNCRVFATEGIVECERFMRNREMNLNNLIDLSFTENIFNNGNRYESSEQYNEKEKFYEEFGITQIPTPISLVSLIQSYTSAYATLQKYNINILDFVQRKNGQTYLDFLNKHTKLNQQGKPINRTIQDRVNKENRKIYNALIAARRGLSTATQEQTTSTSIGPA